MPQFARFAPSAVTLLPVRDLGGRVELCPISAVYGAYPDYPARMRLGTHGMGFFVHPRLGQREPQPLPAAQHA